MSARLPVAARFVRRRISTLFWDEDHPSSAAGPILAAAAADALGVPEPGTATLLAVGLMGLVACRWAHLRRRAPVL